MIKIPSKSSFLGIYLRDRSNKNIVNDILTYQKPKILTDGTTITWNIRENYNAEITLQGSRILAISNLTPGDYGLLKVIQGSGSNLLTLPSSSYASGGSLTLSTTAASIDLLSFYYDGTKLFWTLNTDFQAL